MANLSEVFDLEADEILSQIDEGVVDNMLERARWEEEPINLEDGGQMDLEDEGDMNEDDGDMEGAAEYWEDKDDAFEDVLEMDCDLVEGGDGMVTPMKTKCDGTTVPHPTVGMVFPSWEEVDKYYRSYGKQEGFGVVRIGGAKVRNKEEEMSKSLRGYYWRCESFGRTSYRRMVNGKRVFVSDEAIVKKKSKKCNCPVMIYAGRNKEGEWVLKKAENHHERHKPSPSKSKHIAMYRRDNMTKHLEARIHNDVESGARVSQIYNNIANQRNGVENCGFTKKDMHNVVNKKMRLQLKEGDAAAMLKYFDKMTSHNQNFFHMHRLDDQGQLKDIMWVDARSRVAYEYFGDVVCFDSTYLTNLYELPFANFVGVNHHGQSILLGCALISREDAETFVWLFKTWLSCMGGKPPAAIMTDQDAAIKKAIRIALPMPETRHRWCMWHIMQKFGAKLGALEKYEEIKEVLKNVIYNSITPDEFEEQWVETTKKYELEDKECYEWLEGLYDQRDMWIPAYLKHIFWAGMQTTQRVESINSFFDGYLKKNTRLYQFAPRYCKAMESRAKDEKEADANCSRYIRPLMSEFALERKFQKVYTDSKFKEVQIQCNRVAYLTPIAYHDVSEQVEELTFSDRQWIWSNFLKREIPLSNQQRTYKVTFNKFTKFATCDCKHFECHGIVCRHIIKVMDMHQVKEVPSQYFLDRWRKDIRRKHTVVKVAYYDPSKTEEVKRYDRIMLAFEPVALRASVTDDLVEILLQLIKLMVIQMDEKEGLSESEKNSGERGTVKGTIQSNVPSTPYYVNKEPPVNENGTPMTVAGSASVSTPLVAETFVKDPPARGKKAHRTNHR